MPGNGAAAGRGQPDRLGFGDQIANRQHQPVMPDQHAAAGAFGAKRAGGESILGDPRPQTEHGTQGTVEIEAAFALLWLDLARDLPLNFSRHGGNPSMATDQSYSERVRLA